MSDLFPEVVGWAKAPVCEKPYFIAAVFKGGYWKMWGAKYSSPECVECVSEVERLEKNGWSHIAVLRLPSQLWEGK